MEMIADAAEREIDRWPVGEAIALAPRMQAITLDVIMAGIFGIEGKPRARHARARAAPRDPRAGRGLDVEVRAARRVDEHRPRRAGRDHEVRPRASWTARPTRSSRQRRGAADVEERRDILSLLLQARTEDGEALTDHELRDELLTLVLAGHETTANSLAWAWERLVRTPGAPTTACATRCAAATPTLSAKVVEQTINEAMRSRPVIPIIGRRVKVPWRLGEYAVPAGHAGDDEHPAHPPPRGRLPGPVRVPARALGGPQARHLHVDPVRRRHPALPRRGAGDGRAARRAGGDGAPAGPRRRHAGARARGAPQRDDDPVARRARDGGQPGGRERDDVALGGVGRGEVQEALGVARDRALRRACCRPWWRSARS